MKEVNDAVELRKRIQQVFELAALPGMKEEDIRRILHFVVVGGGPTGAGALLAGYVGRRVAAGWL